MSFHWRFSELASPRKPTNPQEGQLIKSIVFNLQESVLQKMPRLLLWIRAGWKMDVAGKEKKKYMVLIFAIDNIWD